VIEGGTTNGVLSDDGEVRLNKARFRGRRPTDCYLAQITSRRSRLMGMPALYGSHLEIGISTQITQAANLYDVSGMSISC
jgi:hypothetical protein